MRRPSLTGFLLLVVAITGTVAAGAPSTARVATLESPSDVSPSQGPTGHALSRRLLVRFDTGGILAPKGVRGSKLDGLSPETRRLLDSLGAEVSERWCDGRLGLVTLGPDVDVSVALARLQALREVKYVVPDAVVSLAGFVPNDPQF